MAGKADVAKESGKIEKADEPKTIRKLLWPPFFANGLTVILLAYDTSKTKKRIKGTQDLQRGGTKPHCPSPSTEGSGDDGDDDDDGDDGDDNLLGLTEEDDWLEADEAFLEEEETRDGDGDGSDDKGIVEIMESDPMELDEISLPMMDMGLQQEGKQEGNPHLKVNWKQRSRLLENV